MYKICIDKRKTKILCLKKYDNIFIEFNKFCCKSNSVKTNINIEFLMSVKTLPSSQTHFDEYAQMV